MTMALFLKGGLSSSSDVDGITMNLPCVCCHKLGRLADVWREWRKSWLDTISICACIQSYTPKGKEHIGTSTGIVSWQWRGGYEVCLPLGSSSLPISLSPYRIRNHAIRAYWIRFASSIDNDRLPTMILPHVQAKAGSLANICLPLSYICIYVSEGASGNLELPSFTSKAWMNSLTTSCALSSVGFPVTWHCDVTWTSPKAT